MIKILAKVKDKSFAYPFTFKGISNLIQDINQFYSLYEETEIVLTDLPAPLINTLLFKNEEDWEDWEERILKNDLIELGSFKLPKCSILFYYKGPFHNCLENLNQFIKIK